MCACAGAIRSGGAALCLPLYLSRVQDTQDARLLSVLHARYLSPAAAPSFPVPLPTAPSLQVPLPLPTPLLVKIQEKSKVIVLYKKYSQTVGLSAFYFRRTHRRSPVYLTSTPHNCWVCRRTAAWLGRKTPRITSSLYSKVDR